MRKVTNGAWGQDVWPTRFSEKTPKSENDRPEWGWGWGANRQKTARISGSLVLFPFYFIFIEV